METPIVNKVAQSPLLSLDLEDYLDQRENIQFDLSQCLFQGIVLKEKDFRQFIKEHDWNRYAGKNVGVHCSADAIIPSWAYMLVATKLQPHASLIVFGDKEELEKARIDQAIDSLTQKEKLDNAKVVIKGCGNIDNRDYAYFQLTKRLTPLVSSLMYGEPCSTVPVYKKPRP